MLLFIYRRYRKKTGGEGPCATDGKRHCLPKELRFLLWAEIDNRGMHDIVAPRVWSQHEDSRHGV